jgi:transketolase
VATAVSTELQTLAINTIRTLSIDAVQKANSGHPGLPMGAAAMAYTLWQRHLRHNPQNPHWHNRDRFVLSAGHGSMLIYSLLHLTGYDLPLEEIKNFRQWGSKTAGHPEHGETPGVETTTGPLGQGASNAVGMALAEAFLAKQFNRDGHSIVDHYTYALVSDGDLMEGISIESTALAGHWGLGKLIFLYDDNHITLDGEAEMTFTEDIAKRFEAQGWHTLRVSDGNDVEAIDKAIQAAKAESSKPSIILVRTIIGFGSPNKQNSSEAHGSPLGADEVNSIFQARRWNITGKHSIRARHWKRNGMKNSLPTKLLSPKLPPTMNVPSRANSKRVGTRIYLFTAKIPSQWQPVTPSAQPLTPLLPTFPR